MNSHFLMFSLFLAMMIPMASFGQNPESADKHIVTPDYVYDGGYSYGTFNGTGTMTFTNGMVLKGNFVAGQIDDLEATLLYADGTRFVGELDPESLLPRKGCMYYLDGSSYAGTWIANEGKADWKEGRFFRPGVCDAAGTWKRVQGKETTAVLDGEGSYHNLATGDTLTGGWSEGRMTRGQVRLHALSEEIVAFRGRIVRGKADGDGVLTLTDMTISTWWNGGQPKEEMEVHFANGDKVKGAWLGGQPAPMRNVTYTWANGTVMTAMVNKTGRYAKKQYTYKGSAMKAKDAKYLIMQHANIDDVIPMKVPSLEPVSAALQASVEVPAFPKQK